MMNGLAFDSQGVVELGIMVHGDFFLDIRGSAFSSAVANLRDTPGRYWGSSFQAIEDTIAWKTTETPTPRHPAYSPWTNSFFLASYTIACTAGNDG